MTHTVLKRGLFFKEEDIPAIRAKAAQPRYAAVWQGVSGTAKAVAEAESLLLEGDTFAIWYYARNRLMDLALYVLISEDKKAAGVLCALLRDLCGREVDFWQGPHYPNRPRTICHNGKELLAGELETAQLVMGVVIACDWAWQWIDADTRTLVSETLKAVPQMLLRNSVVFQSEKWVMNHLCVLSTALALSSLFLGEEAQPFADDYESAKRGLVLWMEKIEEDGSYGEFYHYWAYPMNCLGLALLALKHSKNEELPGAHRLAKCLPWVLNNQVGRYPVQGFSEPVAVAVNHYDSPYVFQMEAPEMLLFANYFKLPLASWYIDSFLLDNPPRPDCLHHVWHTCNSILLALDDATLPRHSPAEAGLPLASYFADTGYVYFRGGWDNCAALGGDTVLALQSGGGGHSCSHEHYDKNSFSLFANGEYFICDPGHSCYRGECHHLFDTATKSHNTLCIGGEDQTLSFLEKGMLHDEAKHCTSYNNQAVITGKNFAKDISYIASDARRCYTPALGDFTRRIWYVRPDFFLVWDSIDASGHEGEAKNGFNLNNSDGKTGIEVDFGRVLAHRPLSSLQVEYLFPPLEGFEREDTRLHLAYHTLPDQAVEGKPGSALRFTPIPKTPHNTSDYLYLLRPYRPVNEPMAEIEIARLQHKDGRLQSFDVQVNVGDKTSRFTLLEDEVHFSGPAGEAYIF